MKLNFRQQNALSPTSSLPIILIHGLFGNLDNLGVLARDLHKDHDVIQVDLRDHGLSPRSPEVNYPDMAQDVLELMDRLEIKKAIIIGHSMGGKVAMAMTAIAPDRIEKLIAIDVAPIDYQVRRHDQIFTAINAVSTAGVTQRQEATQLMRESIKEEGVIQFLLKSFHNGEWRFNVPALWDQYENIVGWQPIPPWPHPILFIRGELSPYIKDSYRDEIARQFPQARAHVVAGTGHWVHAEKPDSVLRAIHRFIDEESDEDSTGEK
ncbi:TPA: esterase [Yersinia enterocolitica]